MISPFGNFVYPYVATDESNWPRLTAREEVVAAATLNVFVAAPLSFANNASIASRMCVHRLAWRQVASDYERAQFFLDHVQP
jgi:hypothetical protein